jgi:ArsR family transcriptional regulator, arsenate/arsenite/antimonite-responsive transcriptional repressor / arsenate reductase (thioredoxin)
VDILTQGISSVKIDTMSVEATVSIERRVALHAALADSARLRIVDALTWGDAAPSELAAMLQMPSNLVAHHVNVLRDAGLVERHRSEGDRRRSYLRLVPAGLDELALPGLHPPRRVLFLCTANTARSHLAVALWRRASSIPATSAGTHPADRIDARAVSAAERHHVPLRRQRPRAVDGVRAAGDLVITVCDRAHEEVGGDLHWSVPDPVSVGTDAAFDRALGELDRRVAELAPRLVAS